jgi:hypothetical protein
MPPREAISHDCSLPPCGGGAGRGVFQKLGVNMLIDDVQNALKISHDLFVGKTEDTIAACAQPRVASFVMLFARGEIVGRAIDFNDDARRMRDKVDDVLPDGRLSTKRQSVEVICLKGAPQQRFGARHGLAKLFRLAALRSTDCRVWQEPPSLPLPRKGGGNRL